MADIEPTQPLTPSRPVLPPPDERRRQRPGHQQDEDEQANKDSEQKQDKPHDGLIDEYV